MEATTEFLVIPKRFNGPPGSGHGGYTCGMVASLVAGNGGAEVTLRRPPPLETPLGIERAAGEEVTVSDVEGPVATGHPAEVPLDDLPPPVSLDEAAAAELTPPFPGHPFPTCFGCGPLRERGDGLRLFAGPLPGDDGAATGPRATRWTPDAAFARRTGTVDPVYVWAAVDCPSGAACTDLRHEDELFVLGRMSATVLAPVEPEEPHVIVSAPRGREGRKLLSTAALYTPDGDLRAAAHATWITLPRAPREP